MCQARSMLAAILVLATFSSGCVAAGGGRESFCALADRDDGPAALALTVIPAAPPTIAGLVLSSPLLLTGDPRTVLIGPYVLQVLFTPVIAPFWLIGRAIDGVADGTRRSSFSIGEPDSAHPIGSSTSSR
jgi:hypothetical protein